MRRVYFSIPIIHNKSNKNTGNFVIIINDIIINFYFILFKWTCAEKKTTNTTNEVMTRMH